MVRIFINLLIFVVYVKVRFGMASYISFMESPIGGVYSCLLCPSWDLNGHVNNNLGLTKKVLRSTISEQEAEKQVCESITILFHMFLDLYYIKLYELVNLICKVCSWG